MREYHGTTHRRPGFLVRALVVAEQRDRRALVLLDRVKTRQEKDRSEHRDPGPDNVDRDHRSIAVGFGRHDPLKQEPGGKEEPSQPKQQQKAAISCGCGFLVSLLVADDGHMGVLHVQYRSDITLILTRRVVKFMFGGPRRKTCRGRAMTNPIAVLLLAGVAVLLVMALIIVMAAQGLGRTASKPAPAKTPPHAPAKTSVTKDATRHGARPATNSSKAAAAKPDSAKPDSGKPDSGRHAKTVASIVASLAVIGGIAGFVSEFNDGDIEPEVSEINAGALHGTMVNARNSNPVVLIIPGSGPTDRDGNSPLGVKTDAYRLLADALIEERISTVRVDKRGMFGSSGAGDANAVTPESYVSDIHAWNRRHQGRSRRGLGMCLPVGPFGRRADGLARRRRAR